MASPLVGIVTGANKGIGLATVRKLAVQYPTSHLFRTTGASSAPLLVYLAARDQNRGEAAVQQIRADSEVAAVLERGLVDVRFRHLDVASEGSVRALGEFLRTEHAAGVDFLVNNAAVALEGFGPAVVEETMATNYFGLIAVARQVLPHFRPGGGRIINAASASGMLSRYSPEVAARFRAARTEEEVTALIGEFARAVASEGGPEPAGFPRNSYAVSKSGVIGFTRALAAELRVAGSPVLANSFCPGLVQTDMTKGRGARTPDQGAETPVLLALDDVAGRSGGYWTAEKEEEW